MIKEQPAEVGVVTAILGHGVLCSQQPTTMLTVDLQVQGPIRSKQGSPGSPEPELDFGSGSALVLNFGPDLGAVH